MMPKGLFWKLTLLNIVVITSAMALSGWAIYETACYLVDGIGNPTAAGEQSQFNAVLFQYFLIFTVGGVVLAGIIHYYFTKKLIQPLKKLTESTKILKEGKYPHAIQVKTSGEMLEFINHYNELISRLQENEKYRKKLVDDVSHELRTPLSNLQGYLYALKNKDLEGNDALFESLYDQVEDLSYMIEQIEGLNEWQQAEYTMGKKQSVDIVAFIDDFVQIFSLELKRQNITIQSRFADGEIYVNKKGLQQVLTNLVDNAIRYSEKDSKIELFGEKTANYYQITVANTGPYISEEDRKKIFDRFYRIEPSRNRKTGGTGLGLSIAKEIVKQHQGTIEVESASNINSFIVKIPLK